MQQSCVSHNPTKISQRLDFLRHTQTFVVVNAWLLWLLVVGIVVFLLPQVTLERHKHKLDAWAL